MTPFARPLLAGAVVALIAATAVVAYALAWPDRYEADARLQITPVPAADETFAGFSVFRERQGVDVAETAAALVETGPVAEAVAVRLRLDGPEEALERVEAFARGDVVVVRGSAGDPAQATQVANAFADELVRSRAGLFQRELAETLERLRAQIGTLPEDRRDAVAARIAELVAYEGTPDPTLGVAGTAVAPTSPSWPDPVRVLALGIPAALLLGVLAAVVAGGLPRPRVPQVRITVPRLPAPRSAQREEAPPPEPVAAEAPGSGSYTLQTLERLVEERLREGGDVIELRAYLIELRDHAASDGTLPSSFDGLVDDVFGELLRRD